MERKLQERMIGAGVLVAALIVFAPMILDGGPGGADDETAAEVPGQRGDELRTHVFRLDPGASAPPPAPVAAAAGPVPRSGDTGNTPVPTTAVDAGPAGAEMSPPAPPPDPVAVPVTRAPEQPVPVATAPPPAAEMRAPDGGWRVQVGTFGDKGNADRLVKRLRERGYSAASSATRRGDKTLYRVRVGPAADKAAAEQLRAELAAAGQSGQLVPP
jgi:DedD protein